MDQAIILAGGKGERLRPLTENIPKSMVPVLDDKPLLWFMLKWLQSQGIRHVTICCGYRHEVIQDYFGDGSICNLRIEYLIEENPLGRGGALKAALRHLNPGGSVLALNGDLFTDLNVFELLDFHILNKGL